MADFTNPASAGTSLLQASMSPQAKLAYAMLSNQFPQTLPSPQQAQQPGQTAQQPVSPNFGQQLLNNYTGQQAAGNQNYGLSDALGDTAGQYGTAANQALSCCGS